MTTIIAAIMPFHGLILGLVCLAPIGIAALVGGIVAALVTQRRQNKG